jgi:glucuronoarabinoxylan endo-1,4-beta-xylanase
MQRKSIKSKVVFLLALILFGVNLFTIYSMDALPNCKVDWANEKQVIEGFGGSGAFHQAANLMAYPEAERNQILDLLFSQDKGIGLSIVRNIVGDGGDWGKPIDGPTPSIEPQEGVWNWKGDEDQIWLMNEAKKRGCGRFVSTVWSPPAWMKTSNSVIKGGKLRPDKYQAYADYLSNYVRGYKEHHNIDIYAISIANEPDFSAPYSSCLWTGSQFRDFIKNHLSPTLNRDKVDVKVIIPEEMNFSEDYALDTLNDAEASQGVDIIGTHAYDFKAKPFPVAKSQQKSIWQTEVSNIGFNDGSIDDGLKYAKLLHDHMTVTEVNAWLFWWLIAYKPGETLVHLDTSFNTFQTFKRLYTIGNYSRFIRPGYVRIHTDPNPSPNVFVTAYKDRGSGKFAIVVINNGEKEQTIDFNLNKFPKLIAVTPYRTSAKENLAKLDKIAVSKNSFKALLKAKSVTTFVAAENELPGELSFKEIFAPIEAEDFEDQSDIKLERCNEGGSAVSFVKKGAFTTYRNYNFYNGAATCDLRISVSGRGKLELKLGSATLGTVIGKYSFTATETKPTPWMKTVWETISIPVEKARGVNDFYVVFTPWDQGSTYKLNWLEFKAPVKPPAGKIKIQMKNESIDVKTNTIKPYFKIINNGTVPVNLEKVKVRYFYTLDSIAAQQFEYGGGSIPSSEVAGTIVKMNAITPRANFYLEIGFKSNAGTLEPNQEIDLHTAIVAKGSAYRQDNDFSFNSKQDKLIDWEATAGYIDDKLCWGSEPSLLVNSGFEDGTTGWFNFGGPSEITVTDETSHTGTHSLLITGRTETWQGVAQDLLSIMKPGLTYEITAWIKLKNKASDAGRVSIKRSDDRGDNYSWVDSKTVSDEEWTQISGSYELTVTGALRTLQLYTEGPGPGVEYYVDNVVIREVVESKNK